MSKVLLLGSMIVGSSEQIYSSMTATEAQDVSFSVTIIKNASFISRPGLVSLLVTAKGGVFPYTYSLDDSQTFQASPLFNDITEGIHTITVCDGTGTRVKKKIGAF